MAILLALSAAIGYGFSDFLSGFASRKVGANLVVVLSHSTGLAILFLLLPFIPGHLEIHDLVWAVLAGLCGGFGLVILLAAFQVGRMGIISPISAVVGASGPVFFGLWIGEQPSMFALIGVGLAFFAIAFVSTNVDSNRFSLREPGVALAMLSGILIAGFFVSLAQCRRDTGIGLLLTMRATSVLVVGISCILRGESFRKMNGMLGVVILSGVIDLAANVFYLFSTRYGFLMIVAVITSLYPTATVFLAQIVLQERLTRPQWIGVAFAAGSLALIAI